MKKTNENGLVTEKTIYYGDRLPIGYRKNFIASSSYKNR